MKHSWRLRRTLIPQPDVQLRWDQAYQALLRWSIPPSLPPPALFQVPEVPQVPQAVPSTQQVITPKSAPLTPPIPHLPLSLPIS